MQLSGNHPVFLWQYIRQAPWVLRQMSGCQLFLVSILIFKKGLIKDGQNNSKQLLLKHTIEFSFSASNTWSDCRTSNYYAQRIYFWKSNIWGRTKHDFGSCELGTYSPKKWTLEILYFMVNRMCCEQSWNFISIYRYFPLVLVELFIKFVKWKKEI